MWLPSANVCICSVVIVAQNGAAFTGSASMSSTCIVTRPAFGASGGSSAGPPLTATAPPAGVWAIATTAIRAAKRIDARILEYMVLFPPKIRSLLDNSDATCDPVRTYQYVCGHEPSHQRR